MTLTSSSATGNVWSTGATTQSITVSTSGTYSVTVTNGNGCSATSAGTTVTVNPNPATPTITAGGPLTFCAGGNVTLTSSSATGNVWSTGATTQSITTNASGTYTLTVTNGNGCSATSAGTTVTVNPNPATPTIGGPLTFCAAGSALTSSSATGNDVRTGCPTLRHGEHLGQLQRFSDQWQWMQRNERGHHRDGEPQPSHADDQCRRSVDLLLRWQCNADQQQCYGQCVEHGRDHQYHGERLWHLPVTVTNGNGCSATSAGTTVTVNPNPATPTISAGGPLTFCAGGSVTLTSSSAT
ncbi:MAG: hypothetical protein IPN62_16895, partial [Flavobacteriales bacterium]|nr:hypothetical protein [Flavobacteriales bacterium]